MKVGELEKKAGVSAGYFSRISKDSVNTVPGIDVVSRVASTLGVSIDTLVYGRMYNATATDEYVLSVIEKVLADTNSGDLVWYRHGKAFFADPTEDYGEEHWTHPLFTLQYDDGYGHYVYRSAYHEKQEDIMVVDDCFSATIGEDAQLYLMCVGLLQDPRIAPISREYELYLVQDGVPHALCHTNCDNLEIFYLALQQLYDAAAEQCRHTRLAPAVKSILDTYLAGSSKGLIPPQSSNHGSSSTEFIDLYSELDDDDDGELPF